MFLARRMLTVVDGRVAVLEMKVSGQTHLRYTGKLTTEVTDRNIYAR